MEEVKGSIPFSSTQKTRQTCTCKSVRVVFSHRGGLLGVYPLTFTTTNGENMTIPVSSGLRSGAGDAALAVLSVIR
jgi:hypothetical protein